MTDKEAKAGLKLLLGLFVYASTTLVVIGALAFWWAAAQFTAPGPLAANKVVMIESGTGLRGIASKLESEGAVKNGTIFIFGARILGAQSALQAGEYEIQAGMSARDIMNMMRNGDIVGRKITIREGLTSYEVIALLKGIDDLQQVDVSLPKEGTLLPETYQYTSQDNTQDLVQRMETDMQKTIDELWETRAADLPFKTKEEAITLASIVEKETGVAEERRRVAGVFINRLKRGIPLQTDPSVIYAITRGRHKSDGKGPLGRRLLSKDLEIDSPYNTYKYAGLPPGPIANPGRASIEAVLNPEQHDYLYFVADGTGGHVFSKTLAEHNANVAKWRKIRKQKQ